MTDIEEMFAADLAEIKKSGYGFMGKDANELTHDELLIAYKYAIDKMDVSRNDLVQFFELNRNNSKLIDAKFKSIGNELEEFYKNKQ